MKFSRATLAYAIAGFMVPFIWHLVASQFGLFAGYVAALIVIAPVWYIVHYRGLIPTYKGSANVDMGLAVAASVFSHGLMENGFIALPKSLLTVTLMVIGAILAGLLASRLENYLTKVEKEKQ